MIRNLHSGLGIPADTLLQKPGAKLEQPRYDRDAYPIKEMLQGGISPVGAGACARQSSMPKNF